MRDLGDVPVLLYAAILVHGRVICVRSLCRERTPQPARHRDLGVPGCARTPPYTSYRRPRTGRRGQPRVKGAQLSALDRVAATTAFTPVTVTRYRKTAPCRPPMSPCLWYTVLGPGPVQVVVVRGDSRTRRPRPRPGHHRTGRHLCPGHRTVCRPVERSGHRGRKAGLRCRAGPQPHRPRGPGHCPIHSVLPVPGRHLVCHGWPRPADVAEHQARAPWYAANWHASRPNSHAKTPFSAQCRWAQCTFRLSCSRAARASGTQPLSQR
jgi:hypothetical protein